MGGGDTQCWEGRESEGTVHLVSEFGGTHHFNDVECGPGDVIAQHLQLYTVRTT